MLVLLVLCLLAITQGEWVKEMENPGMFEGDIVKDPEEWGYGSIKGGRWPNAVIPYRVESTVSSSIQNVIPKAIAEYHKHTCIRFKKRTTESAYISFYGGGGCSSPIGYYPRRENRVSLAAGCWRLGTVMHEIGHSIGLHHEQSRPDRDSYVEILFDNIIPGRSFNFNKQSYSRVDSLGTPYDYLSMMHYGKGAFGNGKLTIKTKDPYYQDKIGARSGFSKIDIEQINKMYCDGVVVTTKRPVATTQPACVDDPKQPCASWFKYCKTNTFVKQKCCKTCRDGVPCSDRVNDCDKIGKHRCTDSNAGWRDYMARSCKKYCNLC